MGDIAKPESDESRFLCQFFGNTSGSNSSKITDIKSRGLDSLKKISIERTDGIEQRLRDKDVIYVHENCRLNYYAPRHTRTAKRKAKEEKEKNISPIKKLRSTVQNLSDDDSKSDITSKSEDSSLNVSNFDYHGKSSSICFICNKRISSKKGKGVASTITESGHESIMKFVQDRATEHKKNVFRTICSNDLVGSKAKYHKSCYTDLEHQNREEYQVVKSKEINESVRELTRYLEENRDKQLSLTDLTKQLEEKKYQISKPTILSKLKDHFGDNLVITASSGSDTILCLTDTAFEVFSTSCEQNSDSYSQNIEFSTLAEGEKNKAVLDKALNIIMKDIWKVNSDKTTYTASDKMFDDLNKDVPETLQYLLKGIIRPKLLDKENHDMERYERVRTTVAHSIMATNVTKNFKSNLQLAVAVLVHRKFEKKNLVDMFHSLGVSSTYKEASLYEASAADQGEITIKKGTFIQFVCDNADFNIDTLDGNNTFHNLGSIQIITPASGLNDRKPVSRLKNIPSKNEIIEKGNIDVINDVKPAAAGLKNLILEKLDTPTELKSSKEQADLNHFWMLLKFRSDFNFMGWNGYMQFLTKDKKEFEVSYINFLPFINAPPSNLSTLYTALKTCIEHSIKSNLKSCIVTFDQQLYIKALDICFAEELTDSDISIVLVLGGFHLLMSFLGCLGFIMAGSGLKDILVTIYAENSVEHILNGHAYVRAVRAHSLVQLALFKIMILKFTEEDSEFRNLISCEGYDLLSSIDNFDEVKSNPLFEDFVKSFSIKLNELQNKGNTCKLWVLYFKMVDLVKDFIFAERVGHWDLHIKTIESMVPFFHVCGHFNYAKSAHIYVQQMKNLETTMDPEEYKKYVGGFWTARRTNKFFSGIFTDQTIEQTLMRLLSVDGGIFKRGATDSVALKWIKGVIFTKDIIEGLEEFCGVKLEKNFESSQHIDASDTRITKDRSDLNKLVAVFQEQNPFPDFEGLISLSSGMIANDTVNCFNAFEIGKKILETTYGQNMKDIKLSRKDMVVTLYSMNNKLKIGNHEVLIDPNLLFQRILILKKPDELVEFFKYELAPYPQSLFDEYGLRKTQKSDLYEFFTVLNESVKDKINCFYVIDGGMLLHKITWRLHQKFSEICDSYIQYIQSKYGRNVIVVFDGYLFPSIKSSERNRRASKKEPAVDVMPSADANLNISQDRFLSNSKNKDRFIKFLMEKLRAADIFCSQSKGDADRKIVRSAIKMNDNFIDQLNPKKCVVVSEDTDVLLLLNALTPKDKIIYFLKPVRGKVPEKVYSSQNTLQYTEKRKTVLYPNATKHVLFLHAFSGSDTTSAFFNKGKLSAVKAFEENNEIWDCASTFEKPEQNIQDLVISGCKFLLAIYGTPKKIKNQLNSDNIDLETCVKIMQDYRYTSFFAATSNKRRKTAVKLESLIPTVDGFEPHVKRVYLQTQFWIFGNRTFDDNSDDEDNGTEEFHRTFTEESQQTNFLSPFKWGWTYENHQLVPVKMTEKPAPQEILDMIFCSCKTGCASQCGCRKAGLECSPACINCYNINCRNSQLPIHEDELENEDDIENHLETNTEDN